MIVSDQVKNPKDRFSHNKAHMFSMILSVIFIVYFAVGKIYAHNNLNNIYLKSATHRKKDIYIKINRKSLTEK